MSYLVIDVGGTFTKYALMNEACEFLEKGKIPSVRAPLQAFVNSIVGIYEKYKEQVEGMALSLPGIMDSKKGFMYTGGMIECISNINMVGLLSKYCPIPITIANDAKCAAMAEIWRGSLKDCQDAIVMVCGTGIGGAVILNREILFGKHFMAGEFSYPIVESSDPYNINEAFGFKNGIESLIRMASEKMKKPMEELDGKVIFDTANIGDEDALWAIREYSRNLALQIHNYQFILDPERVAIGGGISVQPLLLQIIKEELEKINQVYAPWKIRIPEVVNCEFFNDANLIGALYVHLKQKESNEEQEKIQEIYAALGESKEAKYLKEILSRR